MSEYHLRGRGWLAVIFKELLQMRRSRFNVRLTPPFQESLAAIFKGLKQDVWLSHFHSVVPYFVTAGGRPLPPKALLLQKTGVFSYIGSSCWPLSVLPGPANLGFSFHLLPGRGVLGPISYRETKKATSVSASLGYLHVPPFSTLF